MQLTSDFLRRWEEIVEQVDKDHIPIDCVKKVIFKMQDRKQKTVNLKRLRNQGLDAEMIEVIVENYIRDNEEAIASMEFIVDIEAVAEILQPETDKLLSNLK
jgi:Asp-tRNA(Asn)/Glu-tRNA(Gln) amidotransferase B subunit